MFSTYKELKTLQDELNNKIEKLRDRIYPILKKEIEAYITQMGADWYVFKQADNGNYTTVRLYEDEQILANMVRGLGEMYICANIEVWEDLGWVYLFGRTEALEKKVKIA